MLQAITRDPPELTVTLDRLSFIAAKAKAFDGGFEPLELDTEPSPVDHGEGAALEDDADDSTVDELTAAIDTLNEDEVVEVIALAWMGRGDFEPAEWAEALAMARERHNDRSADYLLGIPNLGDCLEEGLDKLGFSAEEFAFDRP